jgi:branched-chain amino acid transport system permease protein
MFETFFGFAIPGIPFGCTYAVIAVGLVLTYQATGVFNFAFPAQAYAASLVFTALIQSAHLPSWLAFIIAAVIMSPLLGLAFDRLLFSKIPNTNTTAKLVTGISLLVGLPSLLLVAFPSNYYNPPSLIWDINTVYFTFWNIPINGAQISSVVVTVLMLGALVGLLRFTNIGLQMRGAVESRRLVQLDGVNAGGVVAVAWMVSSFLAGMSGILFSPNFGEIQSQNYALLFVFALAAAACGSFRSLPKTAIAAVLIGIGQFLFQGYLPTTGFLFTTVLPSFPFLVLAGALLLMPGLRNLDSSADPLSSVDPPLPPTAAASRLPQMDRMIKIAWYTVLGVFVVSMLTWIPKDWESVLNQGLAFSALFLSITLITGMGGQLSLAQATLAGVGAFTAAQLALHLGLNFLIGGLIGAVVAAMVAVVLAVLSLRLRGLGLALMTLAAALLFDTAIFSNQTLAGGSGGLNIQAKWLGLDLNNPNGHLYFIVAFLVVLLITGMILFIRKGTTGRVLGALKGSETGAAGIGINLTKERIMIFALSGAVAGIGGVLLVIQENVANPQSFNYAFGLIFIVIVVTTGVSTVEGAIQGGFGFVVIQKLLGYAPARFADLTFVFFAFGALTYAAHPEGILEFQKRRSYQRIERFFPSAMKKSEENELAIGIAGGVSDD